MPTSRPGDSETPRPTDPARPPAHRPRRLLVSAGVACLLAGLTVGAITVLQYGPPWGSSDADRNHVHVASDGTRQHYQVHLPPAYDGSQELPVMMALHGCAMTGFGINSMKATTGLNAVADREGFIAVYPTQRRLADIINCWEADDPANQVRGRGEPARLAGVAREVVRLYGADPRRVHVAGASSGAGAAVVLGATYPDVFATVTSVAGGEYGLDRVDPDDPGAVPPTETARLARAQMGDRARQVPLLVVQGGSDEVVPPLVGERLVEQWTAVHDLVDDGALDGSVGLRAVTTTTSPAEERHGYRMTVFRSSDGTVLVEHLLVPELAHAWPGPGGRGTFIDRAGPDASEMAWDFAERHDLRSRVPSPPGVR